MTLVYTNIQHAPRKKWKLSLNEYCLCDSIYHLSNNQRFNGWCIMSKENLGDELGLSKQTILNLVDKLIALGLIFKDEQTKFLKTTQLWYDEFITESKESLPPTVKKVYHHGKESLPNNNIDNNIDNNNIISKDITEETSEYGKPEINNIINLIKGFCLEHGIIYDKTQDRMYAKHICSAKEYNCVAESYKLSSAEFTINVMKASMQVPFWRGKLCGPKSIYTHFAKVINDFSNIKNKEIKQQNSAVVDLEVYAKQQGM